MKWACVLFSPCRAGFAFFFFNDTATTEIYTLSLHDALPISRHPDRRQVQLLRSPSRGRPRARRSEEHTSELQSRSDLVCRLLLEKKKKKKDTTISRYLDKDDTHSSHGD